MLRHLVFSYGTLQQSDVQEATFNRLLHGQPDVLQGYKIDSIEITDQRVIKASGKNIHPILTHTGIPEDRVAGTVFELTEEELALSDDYEVEDYQRVLAVMESGISAWIYCATQ
ncbi:hypothetical protein HMF8227_02767 [Saliniradius amylolyticus]|uniref:Gamma-glutamylcyclotransferase AIG2-like domain-containing protein n=1 Tax=Saliniradius amylolyticus TaxID=2183582 RepID=A0A2S2E6E9_9ALTE|nr:gamma-glutamylcyclotransferase family protein [Saliniradius amylolyticus]AWL13218.1 hypothetical protein HMF8227_02767 [Saliniradius amylolyticus]